jgi:hypothetical protein
MPHIGGPRPPSSLASGLRARRLGIARRTECNHSVDDILKFAVDLVFAAHFQMPQRLAAAFGPAGKLRCEFGAADTLQVATGAVADDGD